MKMNNGNNDDNTVDMEKIVSILETKGGKLAGTTLTAGGEVSKTANEAGSFISKQARNQDTIVLSPLGVLIWEAVNDKDDEFCERLRAVLDKKIISDIRTKVVDSLTDRKTAKKSKDKALADRLGYKEIKKGIPCIYCKASTKKTYDFNVEDGESFAICHRKDCVERRDKKATQLLSRQVTDKLADEHTDQDKSKRRVVSKAAPKKQQQAVGNPALANKSVDELVTMRDNMIKKGKDVVAKIIETELALRAKTPQKTREELEAAIMEKAFAGEDSAQEERELEALAN